MADCSIPQFTADDCLISPFSPLIAASTLSDNEISAMTTTRRPRSLSTPSIASLSPYHDTTEMHLSLLKPKDGVEYFDLESVAKLCISMEKINLSAIPAVPASISAESSASPSTSPSTAYLTPLSSTSPESVYVTPYSSMKGKKEVQEAPHHQERTPTPAPRSWAKIAANSSAAKQPSAEIQDASRETQVDPPDTQVYDIYTRREKNGGRENTPTEGSGRGHAGLSTSSPAPGKKIVLGTKIKTPPHKS